MRDVQPRCLIYLRILLAVFACLAALMSWPEGATAHLMPGNHARINVIEERAYVVLALPLTSFEACGEAGRASLPGGEACLARQIRARFTLSSGGEEAVMDTILFEPPGEGGDHAHTEEVIAMILAMTSSVCA